MGVERLRSTCQKYVRSLLLRIFFFNDPATTEIYTLSLHDALPIWRRQTPNLPRWGGRCRRLAAEEAKDHAGLGSPAPRSEEHTSELQSHSDLVCRLLLEKKKAKNTNNHENGN